MAELSEKIFDAILPAVAREERVIVEAHERLGIPLEDAICAAVRKVCRERAVERNAEGGRRNAEGGM